MKLLATILGSLAFSAIYVSCNSYSIHQDWGGFAFGVTLAVVSAIMYGAADKAEQVNRDRTAHQIVESVLAGKKPLYYLYLRPFHLTNRTRLSVTHRPPIQDSLKPKRVETYEAEVDRALSGRGIPLVGLGRPGEAIGAGRIKTSDEDWQAKFEALADVASGFIVIPSLTSGTWWEINWLVQHKLIHKTVFILPPGSNSESVQLRATKYGELGLNFPSDRSGGVLKLSESGKVLARLSIDVLRNGAIIQDLKLLEDPNEANGKAKENQERLTAINRLKQSRQI